MRRIFALPLLTAVLVLTACGKSDTSTSTEIDSASEADTVGEPPLIERSVFFGNPERFQGRLSPNGDMMSFRAPLDGVMNLWVGPRGDFDNVRPITRDTGRGIPSHFWALDSAHVMFIQDQGGDENWHLYSVDLASGEIVDLSPYDGVQAQMIAQSVDRPGVAIVGMNDRDPRWHDVYSVSLQTGERELLIENDGMAAIMVDNELVVRLAMKSQPDGSYLVLKRSAEEWLPLFEIPFEDYRTTNILGFDADNTGIFLLDSRDRDTAALVRMSLADASIEVIAASDRVDLSSVVMDPETHEPIAYAEDLIRPIYTSVRVDFDDTIASLNAKLSGGSQILAQTLDNRFWTLYTDESDRSPLYQAFDTTTGEIEPLFVTEPKIEGYDLAKMHGVVIPSRDGLDLVSYLTLPVASDTDGDARPDMPVPMVLFVHGGPWGRDVLGYQGTVQWLANRGYAVLQVNFRSSTGFGKAFLNAGNMEWAGNMHNDLLDAKAWAVSEGIALPDKVAIMGGSYGGYATLVGLTFTPEAFACGVDIVGPSNLATLIGTIPPYWESFRAAFARAIGDPETEDGRAMLANRSPLSRVDKITKPLLIGQGANDPRVKQAESDQIVEAMKAREIPVTYVLYPDEGHGFQKPENNLSFFAVTDAFLGECLGGRVEPVGDDFENSSINIVYGAEFIPGLVAQP